MLSAIGADKLTMIVTKGDNEHDNGTKGNTDNHGCTDSYNLDSISFGIGGFKVRMVKAHVVECFTAIECVKCLLSFKSIQKGR